MALLERIKSLRVLEKQLQSSIVNLRRTKGVSEVPKEDGDRGTALMAERMRVQRLEQDSNRLRCVQTALQELVTKSWNGSCINCHEEIDKKRLKAIPETRTCVVCAGKETPAPPPDKESRWRKKRYRSANQGDQPFYPT